MKKPRKYEVVHEKDNPLNRVHMTHSGQRQYPPRGGIEKAEGGVKSIPAIVEKTRRKKGRKAARKQSMAIMLSKARKGE